MSEELDLKFLEPNNLCISEDAFEKFQADSMYQEKEYIILPQNVTPNPEPPDADPKTTTVFDINNTACSSVSDFTSSVSSTMVTEYKEQQNLGLEDNDCLLDSTQGQSSSRVMNTFNINDEQDMIVSNSENLNNQEQTTLLDTPTVNSNITPRKRGRKPKKNLLSPIEKVSADTSESIQNPAISSTPFSTDPENSEMATIKKKRGRPKKVKPNLQMTTDISNSDKEPCSELNMSDNDKSDELSAKKRGGRRGRLQQNLEMIPLENNSAIEEQPQLNENLLNQDNQEIDFEWSNSSTVTVTSKKGKNSLESTAINLEGKEEGLNDGKFKPDSGKSSFSDDDPDDICLSKLKNVPEQSDNNDHEQNCSNDLVTKDDQNNISSQSVEGEFQKAKKRRGRPKKPSQLAETSLSQHIGSTDTLTLKKNNDDDDDDVCLIKLKTKTNDEMQIQYNNAISKKDIDIENIQMVENEVQVSDIEPSNSERPSNSEDNKNSLKRCTKIPQMTDFEYNIDSVFKSDHPEVKTESIDDFDVRDTHKRPVRQKAKKLQYEEESDEDPFANIELSDEEPMRGRRGNKYYSDDEYIPGKRDAAAVDSTDTELSDSNTHTKLEDSKKQKRKKCHKKSDYQSPRKRGKKEEEPTLKISDVMSIEQDFNKSYDIEICSDTSILKEPGGELKHGQSLQQWGSNAEFENFLAKKIQGTSLKIKKIATNTPTESNKIEIPILDPEAKKTFEMCTQTISVSTKSTGVQTTSPQDVSLKENIPLTPEQSEKACYFLNSIVQTTAELGTLMTQKSEDFIKKKINTNHVTDTAKMDYCVQKSFLLLKLAKNNLQQMEEDLETQYEGFLKDNDLAKYREVQKLILPTPTEVNSDSDCEIIEVQSVAPQAKPASKDKPAFNPKTVFLNKELSIKIAKKPNESKKLNIKGKQAVWINDTVMVKKVKPMQSFLAQDSRNKKPPDHFITIKMVSDFFDGYYHKKALSICAPFVSTDWLNINNEYVCNYFTAKGVNSKENSVNNDFNVNSLSDSATLCELNSNVIDPLLLSKNTEISSPESLFTLCFHVINCQLRHKLKEVPQKIKTEHTVANNIPVSLFRLCLETLTNNLMKTVKISSPICTPESFDNINQVFMLPLKSLCHRKIVALLCSHDYSNNDMQSKVLPLKTLSYKTIVAISNFNSKKKIGTYKIMETLKSLCHKKIVTLLASAGGNNKQSEKKLHADRPYIEEQPKDSLDFNAQADNKNKLKTLFSICVKYIQDSQLNSQRNSLCYKAVTPLSSISDNFKLTEKGLPNKTKEPNYSWFTSDEGNGVDTLFSLCLKYIQSKQMIPRRNSNYIFSPKSLHKITFEYIKGLLFANDVFDSPQYGQNVMGGLLINCVNTLSEEAFLNLEQCHMDAPDNSEYCDGFDNEDNFEPELNGEDVVEPSWLSKLNIEELRPCINVNKPVDEQQERIAHIKLEPEDDVSDNILGLVPVKSEPIAGPDEMTIIPNVKPEIEEHAHLRGENSYSADEFENFLASSKLMQTLVESTIDEIYSQRSERVQMEYEPDYDVNNTDTLNLLVPHTFESMNYQKAKGSLMQSSSDESSKNMKNTSKRVYVKRGRGRPKKTDQKSKCDVLAPPVIMKAKENNNTEVATLTRRMKDKIRQKQKQDESTDSENESISVRLRSREKKDTRDQTKDKVKSMPGSKITTVTSNIITPTNEITESIDINSKPTDTSSKVSASSNRLMKVNNEPLNANNTVINTSSKAKNNDIQCNNVDSTEQFEENVVNFTGFTSIETNEMTNYEKCMKYVYERVIPQKEIVDTQNKPLIKQDKEKLKLCTKKEVETVANEQTIKDDVAAREKLKLNENDNRTPISPDAAIELLECEPTLPIFEENVDENIQTGKNRKEAKPASKKIALNSASNDPAVPAFIDRNGWHCYPINSDDVKLYQVAYLCLEKLPESFVQTYFHYQNITTEDKYDEEIIRLTNLNSLNRSANLKDRKPQNHCKRQVKDALENMTEDKIPNESAVDSDHYEELLPSDDESPRVEDEMSQLVQKQSENTLAKSLLMDDHDSDDNVAIKVKKEPLAKEYINSAKKSKKNTAVTEETGDLMLTADKMMNKELTLLHAPVVIDNKLNQTVNKGPVTRQLKKSGSKTSPTGDKKKTEEDSSSEEEKQWVSTKEKLLKRMGKKDRASADDAKRAKLVNEFIERRGVNPDGHQRRVSGRKRRSAKKFLEREKQLRVLQRELFGEMSNDPTVGKRSVAAWKGRRNIRKVLDKKSLARSTVVANMEEFERKRRLNTRQTKLRELLGCEDDVNVLVINDEVCLEYDFKEHRPIVTIHPFFTKVMKAHQYEGVKFMWDACFESLADIEAGHPGGGCILAHCMGLGKTLQVLALLHTVLTHPRVGIRRVLVCCPLSTVLNWVDEIHKWIGPVTNEIKVFELSKLKKTYERAYQLEDWYNGGGIFIIGYELFRSLSTLDPYLDDVRPTIINKIRKALLDPGPDIIVCDEGHLLKNDCSVLAVSMSRVATKRRIVLTGTPMQNNLREYYCMVNFVKPNLLGTYSEYSNRFENPIINGQHRDSSDEDIKLMKARTHILHKVLEGCLQRQEVSVLYPYLPKKYEYTVFINLTQCQWDLYKHYLHHYSRQHLKNNSILKDFHILQKIWSHPQVLHNFQTNAQDMKNKIKLEKLEDDLATEDHEDIKDSVATELWWLQYLDGGNMLDSLESSNKFAVVFRILNECVALGDKVLIFSTSLICLNSLEYFLKKINKWSLGQEYYRLDGSVPAEVRQKWCREFNAENNVNTKLFLVSTRAGCLGLNMTAANRVIIMDTSWNPAHDIQSIFRVYRFGQKKDCFIYRLVAMGTMEQKIYERSVTKQAVACRVVDEQQIDRHYNMAELTELYRYDETGSSVVGGVAVGVRDVALLRVARDTALHAVHEHDSLLRSSEQGLPEDERAAAWMQFQQEQTHKQMENKLIANIPKLTLKRLQGQKYAKTMTIKPEIKTEDKSDDFVPTETKSRRGKKPVKAAQELLQATAASSNVDDTYTNHRQSERINSRIFRLSRETDELKEANMVEKISEILIKHNFHTKSGTMNITELLANVKKIVKQGYISHSDNVDDVTASIAKVLLPQKMSMPALNNIMSESIDNSTIQVTPIEPPALTAPNPKTPSVYKNKKIKDCVDLVNTSIPSTSMSSEPTSILKTVLQDEVVPESRKRRRAAIAAEKHLDSLSRDIIINLDDDLDASDSDFVPRVVIDKPAKTHTNKRKNITNDISLQKDNQDVFEDTVPSTAILSDIEESEVISQSSEIRANKRDSVSEVKPLLKSITKPGPRAFKDKIKQKYNKIIYQQQENVQEPSILLSDEEPAVRYNSITDFESPINADASTNVAVTNSDDDEEVPLPLSLLSNKNFINIVAHTYLNGNPMLDADAATLAAQYSTFKSLKEAEQTGKDIVSGPIYDIACKVIGKKLLKRMQNANLKSSIQVEDANVTIELKNLMQNEQETQKELKIKSSIEKDKNSTASHSQDHRIIELDGEKHKIFYKHNVTEQKSQEEPRTRRKITKDKKRASNRRVNAIDGTVMHDGNQSNNSDVVPVGMIQSAGSLPSGELASSECILPHDDDDMLIIPLEEPSTPTQMYSVSDMPMEITSLQPSQSNSTNALNPTITIIPENYQMPSTSSTPLKSNKNVIKVNKGKIFLPITTVTSGNSTLVEQQPVVTDQPTVVNTICLDSDEEDTATPVTLIRPVIRTDMSAVSMAQISHRSNEIELPAMSDRTETASAQRLHKPLILRQVAAGNAPKFVLVPTSNIPPKIVRAPTLSKAPKEIILSKLAPKEIILPKPAPKEIILPKPAPKEVILPKLGLKETITSQSTGAIKATILTAIAPSADCLTNLRQAGCKVGDFVTISDDGDVQVLQVPPSTSNATSAKDKPKQSTSEVTKKMPPENELTKNKPLPSEVPKQKSSVTELDNQVKASVPKPNSTASIQKQAENRSSKTRSVSISSSSSGSRATSPSDNCPLSILKNVVHIQAADEKPSTSNNKKASLILNSKKSQNTKVPVKSDPTNLPKTSAASVTSKSKEDIINQAKAQLKRLKEQSRSFNAKNTSNSKSLNTINPTLQDQPHKISLSSKSNTSHDKKANADSGLRTIVIDGISKGAKNTSFQTVDVLGTVKSGSGMSMLNTKIEIKKRPSTADVSAAKKKKILETTAKKRALTLQDFNIDDYDDIIELE